MPRVPLTELKRTIATLEARINKSPSLKGASPLRDLDKSPNTYFLRRPSGIMQLDLDTGGGLPAGGLTYLSGPPGGGKSFTLYKYCAMNQRLYGAQSSIVLGGSEAMPDHFFMRQAGMHIAVPDRMIGEREQFRKELGLPSFTKQELADLRQKTVGSVKFATGLHGEELLDTLIDCFESKAFDILGLDSVSALLPEADMAKGMDESQKRAATAGLLTKFFQHYLNGTTGHKGLNNTTVIFIAQVRANAKRSEVQAHIAKYMKEWASEGAWAARHGKLIDIVFWSGSKEKEDQARDAVSLDAAGEDAEKRARREKKKVQTGKVINYEITKGKAGIHEGICGEIDFHFDHQVNDLRTVLIEGLRAGVVAEREGQLTFLRRSVGEAFPGLENMPGTDAALERLGADWELELAVRREILYARGLSCLYGN